MQAKRARSMSPERERSFVDPRGYGSDSEALGGIARSQSLLHPAHDPMVDSYGDIYSPLRSGIRPGSFTFASLNELGMCDTIMYCMKNHLPCRDDCSNTGACP